MTITIRLSEKLEADLRTRLETEDVGLSEFVRQAIAAKLATEPAKKPDAYELWQEHFKGWSSDEPDGAERAEEILREMFRAKHRG